MDHPSPFSRDLPWRTTALVAAALAAFELVLLVLLGTAFLARPLLEGVGGSEPAARSADPAPAVAAPAAKRRVATPKLSREATSVIVLNGNGTAGAASDKAALVQSRGYIVTGTGNAPRTDFARSIVMFRPGFEPEARRLARDFKIRRVAPLDGLSRADLQGAHVALIVGDL